MGTPHVCFADELQQEHHNNNNNNAAGSTNKWLLELEHSTSNSPTPRYERNMGFFQLLSRRFGLRSSDDLVHGACDDAAAGTTAAAAAAAAQEEDAHSSSTDSYSSSLTASRGLAAARLELTSCASSETSSTIDIEEQQQQQNMGKRKSLSRTSFSRLQRRSTSSLRRAFESLALTSRSLSCSGPSPPTPPQPQQPPAPQPLKSALKSASTVELRQQQQHHRVASKSASSSSACSTSSASSASASSKSKVKPPPQRILRQPVSYTYLKGMSGLPTQRVPRSSVCCQYARR
ncbi:T-box protein H15 [Drosophila novamexicana]|uniref:T-box protein H15 n=1 Tax=Drosophila novamexicana TaxID=47314 RepID=UPI0011E59166|nr:T-box protein H15 [Drosophila novamexicana]